MSAKEIHVEIDPETLKANAEFEAKLREAMLKRTEQFTHLPSPNGIDSLSNSSARNKD